MGEASDSHFANLLTNLLTNFPVSISPAQKQITYHWILSMLMQFRQVSEVWKSGCPKCIQMSQRMRLWYLSHRQQAKAQASLRIRAVSPEPSLFAHMKYGSRRKV